ncbi:all-trans-retinol 13,14-reductase [Desulfuromusa kysingii]|uniref:All-trans-retinol 13,14-reductase n=1 Tax=Desulfuromusa kysingii TaxID=37625 RepID=A0A1H3VQM6_9BACT|nr:NAD(P)/FAD-dependent oxidoreductase [Desulfuromusa kysingii]SDZ76398.1 all-trans-retinol 13,14-reductase [Desulfuromusa kysingii]
MSYDAIIIGAGLSGLTSALLLARAGRKVLVVEQHSSPAPVVRGFQRDGNYFDSGFHYAGGFGDGGPLQPLLRHLGIADRLKLFPYSADGFDCLRVSSSGEEYLLPVGFKRIKSYLGGKFPPARAEIEGYLDEIASMWRNVPYLDLDTDLVDFGMESVHGRSLQERLEVFSPWPQLQGLLSMHCLLYGVLPEQTPLSLNAQVAGSYYHSVHGICGGGRQLTQVLLALLKEAKVELQCRADVTQILSADHGVTGVRLHSGEEISAAEVIATVNPAQLPEMLPPATMRPAYLKRLEGLYQTTSAYIVYARSQQSLEFLRGRNMFVQSQAGIFTSTADQVLEERPFYLAAADQNSNNVIKGLIGIVPAPYSEVESFDLSGKQRTAEYRQWKQEMGARLLRMFYNKCPQLPPLELLDLATPLTLRDYSRAPQGAIYGVGRILGQYNPPPVTRLPGLFLAGQGIAGPGLLGSLVSSYLACGSILGHEVLRGELRSCR